MESFLKDMVREAQAQVPGSVGALLAFLAERDARSETAFTIVDNDLQRDKLNKIPISSVASRALDTSFVVDSDSPALVFYTVELSVTLNTIEVELQIDDVVVGNAYLDTALLSGLISLETTTRQQLVGFANAGQTVQLVSSGAGTATVISTLELVF